MPARPRVLLAWELGGGLGHVTKLMLLAERLLANGCDVWAACQNLVSAQATFGRLPVHLLQAPIWVGGPGNVPEPINYAGILARKGWLDVTGLTGLVRGWRDLMHAVAPDLIVANHAPTVLLACRGMDTPIVFADTTFGIPPPTAPFPCMRYWQGEEQIPWMERIETDVLAVANTTLEALRLPGMRHLYDLFANVSTCLLGFEELDHYPQRGAADYLGPIYASDLGDSPDWPQGAGKRLFLYLDANHVAFRPVLAALARTPHSALVYATGLPDAACAQLNSARLRVTHRPLRVREVLTRADSVIHHAGIGLAAQALLAGVPLLMLPKHLEQAMFAVRVGELRAGRVLPSDPRLLPDALHEALDDTTSAEQARRFAARHAGHSPEAVAETLTERCLQRLSAQP
jgi:UDP:flavonoid glycosyltransferase YjiC (YdhE family)